MTKKERDLALAGADCRAAKTLRQMYLEARAEIKETREIAFRELCPACDNDESLHRSGGDWIHSERRGTLYYCRAGRLRDKYAAYDAKARTKRTEGA